ncbi:MAG: helix-hairpin-helix domain-containing protein [Bellilinea sp.]|jgi:predicted DNA-binding helix-hairpin-helix protein
MQTNHSVFSLLNQHADLEVDEKQDQLPSCPVPEQPTSIEDPNIFRAKKSGGGQIALLKTLLTTACERNCSYCPFRAGRDFRRASMKADEMAKTFSQINAAGIAEGLFLSSGIIGGGVRTQDKLMDTAELLRHKYQFRGYLHLKAMPGLEKDQLERAMLLADRVSINLEAPNPQRLSLLAPRKDYFAELIQPLQWADAFRRAHSPNEGFNKRLPSLVTQLVVGAAGEKDTEILNTSAYLYSRLRLSRIYYSPFSPVKDTPLENLPAENPLRPLRLYQASFLLRNYHFSPHEFNYTKSGNLPLDIDPKKAWAQSHLLYQPVELNKAEFNLLLRVPGIGPKAARRIVEYRRSHSIKTLGDLKFIGVSPERAAPFVLLNGKTLLFQPSLW